MVVISVPRSKHRPFEPDLEKETNMEVSARKLILQTAVMFAAFALALFLPAGTMSWPEGWVFLALFFGFTIALGMWLLKHNPELLKERMSGVIRPEQKPWDKALITVTGGLFFVWLVLMPLDAVRFGWSHHLPIWQQAVGAVILLVSFAVFFLTFKENPYLSAVVRFQEDRGHTVVSTGPYHCVRHPMYSGFILFVVGTALLLGSWFGLLFGLVLIVMVTVRAVFEERMLKNELRGYGDYMAAVKYRLIPHVW